MGNLLPTPLVPLPKEGVGREVLMNVLPNVLADAAEIAIDFEIGITQNRISQTLQILVPRGIVRRRIALIVLRTIQLDNQICLGTIKVNDILTDDKLAVKLRLYLAKKLIP